MILTYSIVPVLTKYLTISSCHCKKMPQVKKTEISGSKILGKEQFMPSTYYINLRFL